MDWINTDSDFNFVILYFSEPDESGHEFGPYSKEIKNVLYRCDLLVGYLIDKLKDNKLFDTTNIIITSDHGMDIATEKNSIDLIDYVDLKKFNSYGGLTQINIFPINGKIFSF